MAIKTSLPPAVTVTITPSIVIFTLGALIALYVALMLKQILFVIFLAFIIMSALHPAVSWLERRFRLPKMAGLFLCYLGLLGVILLIGLLVIPPLLQELPSFVEALRLTPVVDSLSLVRDRFSLENLAQLQNLQSLISQLGTTFQTLVQVATATFSGFFSLVTVLVLASYMMLDRDNLYKRVYWVTKEQMHISMAKEFVQTIEYQLGSWVRGQLTLMIVIGVMTYLGLWLLGVPYALPLAVLAGLLEILPNLGPTLAAIPAVIISYVALGPVFAIIAVCMSMLIQFLENNFIVPQIMKKNVDVHPLATIVLILSGYSLAGVAGALFVVPAYLIVRTAYGLWWQSRSREV